MSEINSGERMFKDAPSDGSDGEKKARKTLDTIDYVHFFKEAVSSGESRQTEKELQDKMLKLPEGSRERLQATLDYWQHLMDTSEDESARLNVARFKRELGEMDSTNRTE